MKTELVVIDPMIKGGAQIETNELNVANLRLQKVAVQIMRLLCFCLECDSANSNAQARPRDVRNIRSQFNIVKNELEFAYSHNDFPAASHESNYKVQLIDQKEIQRIRNVKLYSIVTELYNLTHVMLSCDSAALQGFISETDYTDITQLITLVDDAMDYWVGNGADATDCGIKAPAYEILGELTPTPSLAYAQMNEPSKDGPAPVFADTADTNMNGGITGKSLTKKK